MTNRNTGKRLAAVSPSPEQEIGAEGIKAADGKMPFKSKLAKKKLRVALNWRIESSDGKVVWLSAAGNRRDNKGK